MEFKEVTLVIWIVANALDWVTTLDCIELFGIGAESNPLIRRMMRKWGDFTGSIIVRIVVTVVWIPIIFLFWPLVMVGALYMLRASYRNYKILKKYGTR